jgi:hypothetical protein
MEVTGVYDTEIAFDYLYGQYSGSNSTIQSYTGKGSFSSSSQYFTVFYWTSNEDTPSKSFAVHLSSPLSSLSYHSGHSSGGSAFPILMEYQENTLTRNRRLVLPTAARTGVRSSRSSTSAPIPTRSLVPVTSPQQSQSLLPSGSPPPQSLSRSGTGSRSRSRSQSRAPPPTEEERIISLTASGRPPKQKLTFRDIMQIAALGLTAAIAIVVAVMVLVKCYAPRRAKLPQQVRKPLDLYTEEHQY